MIVRDAKNAFQTLQNDIESLKAGHETNIVELNNTIEEYSANERELGLVTQGMEVTRQGYEQGLQLLREAHQDSVDDNAIVVYTENSNYQTEGTVRGVIGCVPTRGAFGVNDGTTYSIVNINTGTQLGSELLGSETVTQVM